MKTRAIGLFFIGMVVCIGAVVRGVTEEEKKGIVTYTDGQVKRKTISAELWQNAPVNTEVLSGDQVRTYQMSRAELDLAQLDIIRLAPRTIVDVIKLYEETKDKTVETEIKLEQGEIWASVHEVEVDTKFDISAPITAAAITGTNLRMKVDADTTTQLKVYKGEVTITNAPERQDLKPQSVAPYQVQGPREVRGPREISIEEWVYRLKSMQQITIDNKGQVISMGDFKKEDTDEKSPWVEWNQRRDKRRLTQLQEL